MTQGDGAAPPPPHMLDTNVFDRVADGRVPASCFVGRRLMVVRVQLAELRASKPERAAALLQVFTDLGAVIVPAASLVWDIDGAGFDEAEWNDGTGRFDAMLARLQALDRKRGDKVHNQLRDIVIAETALKHGAILVTGDKNLRSVVEEFGGTALGPEDLKNDKR